MSEDLVTRLRKELDQQQALIAQAQTRVRQLRLAIAAIEQDYRAQCDEPVPSDWGGIEARPIVRRGELRRALLDCLRNGVMRRSAFGAALKDRGIITTSNSISNALNRLTAKREIRWDPQKRVYLLNEEGLTTDVARPLQLNGVASNGA